MAESVTDRLRGLLLDAVGLRLMTEWPEDLVEDYLNLIDNLVLIAGELDDLINTVGLIPRTPSEETKRRLEAIEDEFGLRKTTQNEELKRKLDELETMIWQSPLN